MKNITNILYISLAVLVFSSVLSCQKEDQEFGAIVTPTNLAINFEIVGQDSANPNGDGTGSVNFTATADNAIAYRFNFGDNTGNIVAPSGMSAHRFNQAGTNSYIVTLIATGRGGVSSSTSVTIEVFSDFNPIDIKNFLSGGALSTKTWYWNASVPAHLGVGPIETADPSYYSASPFEKEDVGCLYEDTMIFSQDDSENISFELVNLGNTYFHRLEVQDELGQPNPGEDTCYEYSTEGVNIVNFAPSTSGLDEATSTQTSFSIQNGGFMSYFIGNNEYEILSITDSEMHLRVIQTEPSGNLLAWYEKFSTSLPISGGGLCDGSTGDDGSGNNDVLVWAEEFDADGAPCSDTWLYDIGAGGWGNNESQYYTDRPENVIVENGLLKIKTLAESFNGSDYTSARIISKTKFEFTYGKVIVRAKFPEGGGTWPAIWMLGANFEVVSWPNCGEIDIAEHIGNEENKIFGTLHYPGNSGGNANGETTIISNATSEFHDYEVQWTDSSITFYVDGVEYHSFINNSNVPFNQDFFLILNTAMGGDLGGAIDPDFDQSTFEIDYIRVYQ
tara:strand:- start:3273 stop:4952 length:1680 start_codon:yes stop_codon:yes gene_type:complete